MSDLKLEFLTTVCEHEHFIPLNLLFPVPCELTTPTDHTHLATPPAAAETEFSVSDEFYRRHFLVGVLLREMEAALQYEVGSIRRRTIRILRDLLAKHDNDSRYREKVGDSIPPCFGSNVCGMEPQGQMARIAQLYFPLVPIVLGHVNRLCSGHAPYISPMLGAASVHPPLEVKGDVCHTDSLPRSLPGSEQHTHSQYTHTTHTNTFRSPINSGEGGGACCHDEYEEPHKP